MNEKTQEVITAASEAMDDTGKLEELIESLSGSSRRARQNAAAAVAEIARENPALLIPHSSAVVDALNRSEAQTRWECLDALSQMIHEDSRACDKGFLGAEAALFDEESGPVRLAAVRFLCKLGATTENRSEKVWALLDEAIQCYHGDFEFQDMLIAVVEFSTGKLAPRVKTELAARMKFDAENGKGTLKRRASQIVSNLQES